MTNKHKKIAAASVAAAIALSGALGWNAYRNTPAYALKEIATAIQERDRVMFERRVDLDALTKTAVDDLIAQMIAEASAEADRDDSGFAAMGVGMAVAMMEGAKPAMVTAMRSGVLNAVEKGAIDSLYSESAGNSDGPDFATLARNTGGRPDGFRGLGEIKRSGGTATAEMLLHDKHADTTLALRVKLEQGADGWRITRFDNLREYLASTEEVRDARLAEANREIDQRIAGLVRVGDPTPEAWRSGWYDAKLQVKAPVTNTGSEPLKAVIVDLEVDGLPLQERDMVLRAGEIAPGASAQAQSPTINYNEYIPWHNGLFKGTLKPIVRSVTLTRNGEAETIRRFGDWEEYVSFQESKASAASPAAR